MLPAGRTIIGSFPHFSIFGADNNVLTSRCFLFPILFGKRKRPRLPERMLGSNHILSEAARTLEHDRKSGIIPFFIRFPIVPGKKKSTDKEMNRLCRDSISLVLLSFFYRQIHEVETHARPHYHRKHEKRVGELVCRHLHVWRWR